MTGRVDQAAAWIYKGVWKFIVDWLRVPPPPTLPSRTGEKVKTFHPAPGFLQYLKFWFWLVLIVFDGLIALGWIIIFSVHNAVGLVLLPLFLFVAIVPDIIAYVAIHLRYDTTWYVMSERAMRLRRGVWSITEVTITYENVQNVKVKSGPIQRGFGIKDVIVETAGAGSGNGEQGASVTNQGLIEGVADAEHIRDLIMRRVRASQSTGLGDEPHRRPSADAGRWSTAHLEALRGIRDEIRAAHT